MFLSSIKHVSVCYILLGFNKLQHVLQHTTYVFFLFIYDVSTAKIWCLCYVWHISMGNKNDVWYSTYYVLTIPYMGNIIISYINHIVNIRYLLRRCIICNQYYIYYNFNLQYLFNVTGYTLYISDICIIIYYRM